MSTTADTRDYFGELENSVYTALETYSNVHRGSGHNSAVSTRLFEEARDIVLDYLGVEKKHNVVIFCSPGGAAALAEKLSPEDYRLASSGDLGLSLGVRAIVVARKALKRVTPVQTGGGTAILMAPDWVIWAAPPDIFEAGTPAIINIIAFACALRMSMKCGKDIFRNPAPEKLTASEILHGDDPETSSGRELLDALREKQIGRTVLVPTAEGLRPYINLDNSASTPTFTPIWNAFRHTLRAPAHIHQDLIREVKDICAGVLGAPRSDYDVMFTSNTTEAINLAADSVSREREHGADQVILSTLLEHSSNDLPWRRVSSSVIRLSIDDDGFVDLREMDAMLSAYNERGAHGVKRITLVAVSGASNVLGVYNDLAEIGRIAHRYGAHLLVDAAQMVAHRKVEMERCGIDYLAFSAHKVYAPFGTGVLAARKGLLKFTPEEGEHIRASGEENPGGIAALGRALLILQRIGLDLIQEEERALTGKTLKGMRQIQGLSIYGISDSGSPAFAHKGGVIVFTMNNMMANRVAEALAAQRGIGVRSGCHCAHILVKHILHISPSLQSFQRIIFRMFHGLRPPGVTRVSFGIENTSEDVDVLIRVLKDIAGKKISNNTDVTKQGKDFVTAAAVRVYSPGCDVRI